MRNIKQLFFKGLILSAIFLLLSCSNDDSNTHLQIHGAWQYIGYIQNGKYYDYEGDNCKQGRIIIFKNDNTGLNRFLDCDRNKMNYYFTWEHNHDNIYDFKWLGTSSDELVITFYGKNKMQINRSIKPEHKSVYKRYLL